MNRPQNSRDRALALVANIGDLDVKRAAERSLSGTASMNKMVRAFHLVYGMPIVNADKAKENFSHMTPERLAMRFGLIVEEFMELCEAMDFRADINFYYKDEDGDYVRAMGDDLDIDPVLDHDDIEDEEMHKIVRGRVSDAIQNTEERCVPDVADALFDLKYVMTGFELETGINSQECANEGQASNLSKLMPDGSVLRREDGKVLKGPNYFKPDMATALRMWGMKEV